MAVWKRKSNNYPDKGFDVEEFGKAYRNGWNIIHESVDSLREIKKNVYGGIEKGRRALGLKPSEKFGNPIKEKPSIQDRARQLRKKVYGR